MTSYTYDLNTLLNKAGEQGNFALENFLLQVDGLVNSGEATTEKIMDNLIEFLHGLVD